MGGFGRAAAVLMPLNGHNGGELVAGSGGVRRKVWGVLAAYLLVLQATLTGLALGALPVAADPFSTLCASGSATDRPDPVKPHGGLPDCCVAGCPMLGGGMAPPTDAVAAHGPLISAAAAPILDGRDVAPSLTHRSPRSTRGPPATA